MNNLSRIEMLEKSLKKLIENSRETADDWDCVEEPLCHNKYEYYVGECVYWLEVTKKHIETIEDEAYWKGYEYGKDVFSHE